MPRPITMTDKMKQKAKKEFSEMLDSVKMSNGELCYNHVFKYKNGSVTIWLTPEAYRKIIALVTGLQDEVGWHGTVTRHSDKEFLIEDIFVYPQEVTGSTVNTDQKKYTEWLYDLDSDIFNKIRMQGHSHVNMGVSPSGVDNRHRQQILEQLDEDMFYIFMIWNKSLAVHTLVYDMAENILYEEDEVNIRLLGDENMTDFISDAKEKIKKAERSKYHKQLSLDDDEGFDYGSLDDMYSRNHYANYGG